MRNYFFLEINSSRFNFFQKKFVLLCILYKEVIEVGGKKECF